MTFLSENRRQTMLWSITGIALLVLLYLIKPVLTPFAVAAVFAYICDPAVNGLVRRNMPRPAAVLLVITSMGLIVLVSLLGLIPTVYREVLSLFARMPDLIELANQRLVPWINQSAGTSLQLDVASVKELLSNHSEEATDVAQLILLQAKKGGGALLSVGTNLVLIPVVMFYLLQEWPRILKALQSLIPRPALNKTNRLFGDIDLVLSEFLRGQLSVMLLLATFYSIALSIAGIKFALPVGVLTGLLCFIPFVGFSGGLILAISAALLQGGGWSPLIGVAVIYTIGQFIESYLLTPYLVGDRIGLHPLAVIFALMAFGQLFGFVGMLIALPASAAIMVGLREVIHAWWSSDIYLGQGQQKELDGME